MTAAPLSRPVSFRPSWAGIIAFVVAMAVAVGLAGPFGMTTSQPDPLMRIAHFLIASVGIAALTIGLSEGLARLRPQLGVWALAVGALFAAAPGAFLVQASLHIFSPVSLAHVSWIGLLLQTVAMNMILALFAWRLLGGRLEAQRIAEVVREAGPGLSQRLPAELRSAPVLALQAEDHYLRVFTTRGEALIHMRIGDAEQVLTAEDGVRTHRSFWVARRSFQSVERKEGRMALVLTDGRTVPVSRSRVDAVNAWLERA
jgi:DNA-binding LytR/AlgR family response regulator